MSLRKRQRALVMASAIALVGFGAAVVLPDSSASAAGPTTRTVTKATKGGYITTIHYGNGATVRTYSYHPVATPAAPATKRMTAADGSSVHTMSGEVVIDEGITAANKTTAAVPAASLPSAYDMLRAMGVSPAEAAPFQDTPTVTSTHSPAKSVAAKSAAAKSAAAKPKAIGGGTRTVRPAATVSSSQLYDLSCVDFDYDGSHGHFHGCDWQYKVSANGGDWYMEDRHLATVAMRDTAVFNPDTLTGVLFGIHYAANNVIGNWSPAGRKSMGSCTTTSSSVTVQGTTISSSKTECPETWGVYAITNQTFTTKWDGQGDGPNDDVRYTHGVAAVHSPSSASPTRSLPYQIWWD